MVRKHKDNLINGFENEIMISSVHCYINCFPVAVLQSPGRKQDEIVVMGDDISSECYFF